MRTHILSFFAGVLLLTVLPVLPDPSGFWWVVAFIGLPLAVLVIVRSFVYTKQIRLLSGVLAAGALGFVWIDWQAHTHQQHIIPQGWEGKNILVEGTVASLPEWRESSRDGGGSGWGNSNSLRFVLNVDQAQLLETGADLTPYKLRGKIRLSWYRDYPEHMVAGERWRLVIRAKRPNGFMNPGGFDYEQWLFAQRYVATGYVRKFDANQRVADASAWHSNHWRQTIRDALERSLHQEAQAETGLLQGLSIGYRAAISQEQWDVLRKTGTTHLLAISGLHIGLVAGFGFLLVLPFWWLFPRLYDYVPLQVAGAVVGAGLAVAYAVLAGLTIPTQRALVMVLVLMVGLLLRQRIPFSLTLSIALLLVLLIDPFAPLSAGFWLSFAAVGLLALLRYRRQQAGWGTVLWMQLALSLGMLPLTAAFFGEVSLVSPLANLVAIPWVSFLVVPWVLLGVVCLPVSPELAQTLWWLVAESLHYLMQFLTLLANGELASWFVPDVPWLVLLLCGLGVALLLLPRGVPGRWLGLLVFLPLFLYQPDVPDAGDFRLTVLDVGQGSARVVQTRHHVLVFDAGPKSSPTFDTGKLVVLPFLRSQGVRHVDTLLVSHADKDHSGGMQALLAGVDVARVYVNDAALQEQFGGVACKAGQAWRWDGVDFAVVHPAREFVHGKRNNRSCVLRVSNGAHSVLLAADIERAAEKWLARNASAAIAADVLLVPHHGSLTSSSPLFLNAVDPQWAVVSSGYRNRFRHPHPKVVARYRARGIPLFNTAETGALRLDFRREESAPDIQSWREQNHRFYHR